ncbi:MAG TPA: type II toxin-antitoxin system HicA family toxin [Candidatus Hydrogenedentes bacterium]|nr:type II toxin-antitoxin system HicA family toxin [Candidatus Hydrogenedentota bacterium]HNT87994.1 type II toxin-antitoxin system HicA family toxin [Candidatus Hydrogenedentota bacterium]
MTSSQHRTLKAVFESPTRADIRWADVESLFKALGADIIERRGSRVCIVLNGVPSVFHRPHPERIAGKKMVESVRAMLKAMGIEP